MLDRIRRTLRAAREEWRRAVNEAMAFHYGGPVRPAGARDDDRIPSRPNCDCTTPRPRIEGERGPEIVFNVRGGEVSEEDAAAIKRALDRYARKTGATRWQG